MKTIPRLLSFPFLLLALVSAQEALAGSCGTNKCSAIANYVAPYVPPARPPAPARAPSTASTSRGFTATGGTRVADVNLSPEGLERLAAMDKEEPLPKEYSPAPERTKLAAKPSKPRVRLWTDSPWREAKPSTRRSVARPVKPAIAVKVAIVATAKSKN